MAFLKFFITFSIIAAFLNIAPRNSVTIDIQNIKGTKGTLQIAIYNRSISFPKVGGEYKLMQYKVADGQSKFKIDNLPNGDYAIAIHHDENSDGKMNTNMIGIPKEGYAFSRNFKPKFSAPSFLDCVIKVNSDQNMTINLIY